VRHGTLGWRVAVDAADFASGNTRGELVYKDTAPRGLYRGNRLGAERADNQPLVQNIPTMLVKNACRVSITGHRSSMGTFTQYTIDVQGSIWSSATRARAGSGPRAPGRATNTASSFARPTRRGPAARPCTR
jgi:hypothetical protein